MAMYDSRIDGNNDSRFSKYNKYRNLLILIISLIGLIIVLAMISVYSANRFSKATRELEAVAQQGVIVQQLSKNLLDINLYLAESLEKSPNEEQVVLTENLSQDTLYRIHEVKNQQKIFTQTLAALKNGGTVSMLDGSQVTIDKISSKELQGVLQKMDEIWTPYFGLLNNFIVDTEKKVIRKQTSDYLVGYTRLYNQSLQSEIDDISIGLSSKAHQQANLVTIIQGLGVLGAFALFLFIVFGVLRQLVDNDKLLEIARRETTEIMETVNTGLFLLDKNLNIGHQYSKALENIIGTSQLAGESFSGVLRNRISDKDLQTTEEFITQLYNPRVKEKLVDSLNPLNKILVQDGMSSDGRYLDFKFSRVYEDKDIARILVNVNDVSEAVRLEQRLEKERAENDMQIEMLTTILNAKPALVNDFIENTFNRIEKMNNILKNPGSSQFELEGKLKAIYREMHSLKGESSALKLHSFTKIASNAEDKLNQLQNESKLVGNDFLSLAVNLDELLTLSNTILKLSERLGETTQITNIDERIFGGKSTSATETQSIDTKAFNNMYALTPEVSPKQAVNAQLASYLVDFGQEIAKRQSKLVDVNVSKMADVDIPQHLFSVVKEILIQLLRNAVVHGIDSTEERLEKGKSQRGTVSVVMKNDQQDFMFAIEDDGKGIDYDAIRKKLADSQQYVPDYVEALNQQQLLGFLFSSGFSTRDVTDEDGGRGVGLDIIKERVKEFGGKMNVQSEKDKFTRFIIKLPIHKN